MSVGEVRTDLDRSASIWGESKPFVSVIIPCRNERKYVGKCLDSIIDSDYPKDRMEVLVVDGMSDDGSRTVIQGYICNYSFIKLLDNPRKIAPAAMNIGIRESAGDYILILGAHSEIDRHFLRINIESLMKYGVDCVGGVIKTIPTNNTPAGLAIAISVSHPFGIGNAYFRIGSDELRNVDTVPFGCYRRDVFQRIGFFDEDLIRNQDDEFNFRLIKSGGTVMLVPNIVSHYYARDSFSKLWRMYFQYGYFKPLVASKVKSVLTWRQLIPPLFVGGLISTFIAGLLSRTFIWIFISTVILYASVNVYYSYRIARKKGLDCFPWLVASFLTLHFSYGLGYLKGIWDFLLKRKYKRRKVNDAPLTR